MSIGQNITIYAFKNGLFGTIKDNMNILIKYRTDEAILILCPFINAL